MDAASEKAKQVADALSLDKLTKSLPSVDEAKAAASSAYAAASSTVSSGLSAAKSYIPTTNSALTATYRPLRAPHLPRSSHSLSVVSGRAYIFGGEIAPRQPVDNHMHVVTIPTGELQDADYEAVPAKPSVPGGPVPAARVGHVAASVGNAVFVHGGRGGPDMAALEEGGRVWMFDTKTRAWTALDPADPKAPFPPVRSYHCATASEHPLPPPKPNTVDVTAGDHPDKPGASQPAPPATGAFGTLFIHAGCLTGGGRARDLWAFDVAARAWSPFPDAPAPERGGTALALAGSRLYRYGGFDGKTELGGAVDWLDVAVATADDNHGLYELALSPKGSTSWYSDTFSVSSESVTASGPPNRSVAGLAPISTGQGRHYLLVIGGETTPSTDGHAAAGKFLSDAWAFQLKPEGMSAAAVRDAAKGVLLGMETGEATFAPVSARDGDGVPVEKSPMGGRGWFACAPLGDASLGGGASVLVHGGIDETNERLGDGWIVTVE